MTTKKHSPEDVRAALQKARAEMLDPMDLPRTWTSRQVNEHEERARLLALHDHGIAHQMSMLADASRRRSSLQADLDRLRAAEKTIDQQIAAAADWRTIVDPRARDAEWARQQTLPAAKRALHSGVEYFNGHPALPEPLRGLLTDTCASCGHAEVLWPGPISLLEAEIASLTTQIQEHETLLASHFGGAEALLATTTAVS